MVDVLSCLISRGFCDWQVSASCYWGPLLCAPHLVATTSGKVVHTSTPIPPAGNARGPSPCGWSSQPAFLSQPAAHSRAAAPGVEWKGSPASPVKPDRNKVQNAPSKKASKMDNKMDFGQKPQNFRLDG